MMRPMGLYTGTPTRVDDRVRAHLRQQMHDREISRTEAATRLGITHQHISRILRGERGARLSLALTDRIAREFGVNPTRLLQHDPPIRFFQQDTEKF